MNKVYSGLDMLPTGRADESITEGCIVLEGGGWKGLYTLGVLDYLMPIHGRMHTVLCMFLAILLAVAVYLVLTITMRMITKEDMGLIPGGEKIARLLRMQ